MAVKNLLKDSYLVASHMQFLNNWQPYTDKTNMGGRVKYSI